MSKSEGSTSPASADGASRESRRIAGIFKGSSLCSWEAWTDRPSCGEVRESAGNRLILAILAVSVPTTQNDINCEVQRGGRTARARHPADESGPYFSLIDAPSSQSRSTTFRRPA